MTHTEEEIITKAKQIVKDFRGEFYFEDCTDGAVFSKEEEIREGKFKGKTLSIWTVHVKSIFDNFDHLYISDATGEPILYQNFNMFMFDIEKDENNKYFKVELD
jgi:hypothetical protein